MIVHTQSKDQPILINNGICKVFGPNFNKTKGGFLLFRLHKNRVGIPRDDLDSSCYVEIILVSFWFSSVIHIHMNSLFYFF